MNPSSPSPFGATAVFPRWSLPQCTGDQAVDAALDRFRELEGRWRQCGADLTRAKERSVRAAAQRADTEAFAAAITAGKKDGGTPAEDALDAQLRDLSRRKAALGVAANTAAQALTATLAEHRDDLEAKAAAARRTAEAAYLVAVDVLEEKAAELAQRRRLEEWARSFPDGATRMPWGRPLRLPLNTVQGEPTSQTLAAALRHALGPPTPPTIGGTALARTTGQLAA